MEGSSAPVAPLAQTDETCFRDLFPRSPSPPAQLPAHTHALPAQAELSLAREPKVSSSKQQPPAAGIPAPLPGLSSHAEATLLDACVVKQ